MSNNNKPAQLTALQQYNIEQALLKGKNIEAVKLYREAADSSLSEAKSAIERILPDLKSRKPWAFKGQENAGIVTEAVVRQKPSIRPSALILFFLVDSLIFAGLIYYFVFRDDGAENTPSPSAQILHEQAKQAELNESKQALKANPGVGDEPLPVAYRRSVKLPSQIKEGKFTEELVNDESFDSLYRKKIASTRYILRKNSSDGSRDYDSSKLERKIKTVRSELARQRVTPGDVLPLTVSPTVSPPVLDGVIEPEEWQGSLSVLLHGGLQTRLYFKVVEGWLFIGADVPAEKTAAGYDQLRFYLHAGLTENLINERIHIGRGKGVTAIRQTGFRWLGSPPKNEDERWKRYKISDWGLYKYAYGISSMVSGHRQYEAAVLMEEVGLHFGIPFTVFAEIETDPLKNAQGKFLERQYLGEWGSQDSPEWMVVIK